MEQLTATLLYGPPTPVPSDAPSVADVVTESLAAAGESTNRFFDNLPLLLTRLLMAGAAILIGYVLLRVGRAVIARTLRKKEGRGRNQQQRETFRALVESVFNYLMYFIIGTVVLSIFGVNVSSIIAVAGVGGIAIGFGAQTLVKDIISGVFLWAEGNVAVGDTIVVGGMTGKVESISLRTTVLRDYNGDLYVVPNGDIRTVVNMSRDFKRAVVPVRLNYEEDLEEMLSILRDEMGECRKVIPGLREAPRVDGVTDMAGDCITVQISALCDPGAQVDIARALRLRIKARFDREGILFPHGPVMAKRER